MLAIARRVARLRGLCVLFARQYGILIVYYHRLVMNCAKCHGNGYVAILCPKRSNGPQTSNQRTTKSRVWCNSRWFLSVTRPFIDLNQAIKVGRDHDPKEAVVNNGNIPKASNRNEQEALTSGFKQCKGQFDDTHWQSLYSLLDGYEHTLWYWVWKSVFSCTSQRSVAVGATVFCSGYLWRTKCKFGIAMFHNRSPYHWASWMSVHMWCSSHEGLNLLSRSDHSIQLKALNITMLSRRRCSWNMEVWYLIPRRADLSLNRSRNIH